MKECLSEGPGLHFVVSKVLLSLTATPFSCSSFSSIRLPFTPPPPRPCLSRPHSPFSLCVFPPPSLFLMSFCHILLAAPPPPLSSPLTTSCCNFKAKRGEKGRIFDLVNCTSSFVFMPTQSFLQGCACVVHTAVSVFSSIWVEVIGTTHGCMSVQSVPVAIGLIRRQLR